MDKLWSIDLQEVRDVDDVRSCLGPYGSVVRLEISRPSEPACTATHVNLVREILASKRAREEYSMGLGSSGSVTTGVLRCHLQMTTGSVEADAREGELGCCTGSEDEARKLVMLSTYLEMNNRSIVSENKTGFADFRSFGKAKKPWRRVCVHVTTGGMLVVDKTIMGMAIMFATHSPEATSDLQELQHLIFSKDDRAKDALEASLCFQVHLSTGKRGQAISQRGLLEVDFTQMIEFRGSDPIEASTWVRGINALLSHFSLPFGTRPVFAVPEQTQQRRGRQVLVEMGFTEHQIASAREALQREAQELLPASLINRVNNDTLHSDETLLEWLMNHQVQPQEQANATLGFAPSR